MGGAEKGVPDLSKKLPDLQAIIPWRRTEIPLKDLIKIPQVLITDSIGDIVDIAVSVFQQKGRLGHSLFLHQLSIVLSRFSVDLPGKIIYIVMEHLSQSR